MTATLQAPSPQTKQLSLADAMRRAADWLDEHPGLAELVKDIHPSPKLTLHFSRLDNVRAALKGHEVTEDSCSFYRHYTADLGGFLVTALGEAIARPPERKFTL